MQTVIAALKQQFISPLLVTWFFINGVSNTISIGSDNIRDGIVRDVIRLLRWTPDVKLWNWRVTVF